MDAAEEAATFRRFVKLCRLLESTRSRTEKVALISSYLSGLGAEDASIAAQLLAGRPLPEAAPGRLEVGGVTLMRLAQSRRLQSPLFSGPLTLRELGETLERAGSIRGRGSRTLRENLIQGLLNRAGSEEKRRLLKILSGEMQIGVVEGLVLEALARLCATPLEDIRRGLMILGSLRTLTRTAMTDPKALYSLRIRPFMPLRPMLAGTAYSVSEVFRKHRHGTLLEFKLDGARIQIHKSRGEVKVYSRSLSEVSGSLPDICALAAEEVKAKEAILDGELVAADASGRPLPFQDLMRRFRRVRGVPESARRLPLRLHLFDILLLDGRELIDEPLAERRGMLEGIINPGYLTEALRADSPAQADGFMARALREGHEGLMAKALDSRYTIGSRGDRWLKIKPYQTLDLAITAADWGYGRRTGWLSNYHLAALDTKRQGLAVVGKTFKGLTDDEFKAMTDRLLRIKVSESGSTVYVRPEVVVEVAFNEVQRSPRYRSGFALRFARIARVRDDKRLDEIDTLDAVRRIYEDQSRRKGRMQNL